jgi:hypothetical protein
MSIRSERSARKAVLALASALGVPCSRRSCEGAYEWDGTSLATFASGGERIDARSILHNVAHWVCATRVRRTRPEFGLGRSPARGANPFVKRLVPEALSDIEEVATSLVSIGLEYYLQITGAYDEGPEFEYGFQDVDRKRLLSGWRLVKRRSVSRRLEEAGVSSPRKILANALRFAREAKQCAG